MPRKTRKGTESKKMLEAEELTYKIRGCVFEVSRQLGGGFLEKVYENALLVELRNNGLNALNQQPINVYYKEQIVGEYIADLIVENQVLIELKAMSSLSSAHEAQLLNYLKATNIKIGLLVNFTHPKAVIKRLVL